MLAMSLPNLLFALVGVAAGFGASTALHALTSRYLIRNTHPMARSRAECPVVVPDSRLPMEDETDVRTWHGHTPGHAARASEAIAQSRAWPNAR